MAGQLKLLKVALQLVFRERRAPLLANAQPEGRFLPEAALGQYQKAHPRLRRKFEVVSRGLPKPPHRYTRQSSRLRDDHLPSPRCLRVEREFQSYFAHCP